MQEEVGRRVTIRRILLTYPQCSMEPQEVLETLKGKLPPFDEYIIAKETHADGNKHIHATIALNKGMRTHWNKQKMQSMFDIENHHCDIEFLAKAKDYHRAITYCMKENNYISDGIDLEGIKQRINNGTHTKTKKPCREILETDIRTLVENDDISPVQFNTIFKAQQVWKLVSGQNVDLLDVRGSWFHGPAGSGKSMTARLIGTKLGGYYLKPQNKWWDGYQGEPVVIIDDLDTSVLSYYLKIWGDRYAFTGETKGGTVPIPCKKLIITSNYSIKELLLKDSKTGEIDERLLDALERRYKQREFAHVWTRAEREAFNIAQEDEIARLIRAERNSTEEPASKKAPTLEDDVPTPVIEGTTLLEVPQQEEIEAPQGEDSYSLVLEGHTALNLFNDTWLSGYHE